MIQAASSGLQSLLTLVNLLKVSCQQSCPGQHDVNSLRFIACMEFWVDVNSELTGY